METTHCAANGDGCSDPASDKLSAADRERRQIGIFRPGGEGYRLPHDVADKLKVALLVYRNREAAMALAIFLARYWSSRSRLVRPFPIDRRALTDHDALGLTEARIRGAIRVLEEVGYLHRGVEAGGSVHRLTAAGELHRKPILFGFGPDYGPSFAVANARAERARLRRQGKAVQGNPIVRNATSAARHRKPMNMTIPLPTAAVSFGQASRQPPIVTARQPEGYLRSPRGTAGHGTLSPKDKIPKGNRLLMGEVANGSSEEPGVSRPARPSALEEAITRLRLTMLGQR